MARINIEDSLFRDDRFLDLIANVGNKTLALGIVVEAFILAQKHYLNESNDRLIPLNEWQRSLNGIQLEKVGIAEVRSNGVYLKGSEKAFSWLLQRSNAGKSSYLARSTTKDLGLIPFNDRSTTVQPLPLTLTPRISQFSYLSEVVVGEQKPPPTIKKLNSVERFDAAMKMSSDLEGKKFVDFFNEQSKLKILERFLPEIFSHFGVFENFLLFYDGVLSSKSFLKDENHSRRMRYFSAALKKEIGA